MKKNRLQTIMIFSFLLLMVNPLKGQENRRQVLDKQKILESFSWWDNKDWDWYKEKIPFFESPETVIDATYYYRWEVMTKHLIYGSPQTGYTFTEFVDRPNWSGTYGGISCALGHQFYEVRWLKDRRVIEDFARYWFETPGAQPRTYSNWYGDSMWEIYSVWQDKNFLEKVYPHMQQQHQGWMEEHWDAEHRMFEWDGMHDGMETNINSRQTENWFSGGDGYRPTLNSYMYADLLALSNTAELLGNQEKASGYAQKAGRLKQRVQQELWDPDRRFFFHQWSQDKRNGIKAKTLTHETGEHAGSEHGRELIGYVPWQFNLPDGSYNEAWKFLMDENYFMSDYGPTVAEQGDPMFHVSPRCCVWSGNSWPYATTQTLVALANLLNNYEQDYIGKEDYFEVLRRYSRTQRLNGRPYIAEACNPFTGSWEGHNHFYHSEHYLHSGYVNLIITGLAGLRPRADDTLEVNPLIPDDWDYFALEDVSYHGHSVTILWDREGNRYNQGEGLVLLVDGEKVASSPEVGRLTAKIKPAGEYPEPEKPHNFAVNNEKQYYPRISASYSHPKHPPYYAVDGNYWYHETPPNRWTTEGSDNDTEWIAVDFGTKRPVEEVKLYFLDDEKSVKAPSHYDLEYWDGTSWQTIPGQQRKYKHPRGHRPNSITFKQLQTSRIRVVMTPMPHAAVGLTEVEVWGEGALPLEEPGAKGSNLIYNPDGQGFPKISASYTSQHDQLEEIRDMKAILLTRSNNRWTAYESPNASDWVEVEFEAPETVSRFDLYLYGDQRGVKAPQSITIEYWNGNQWQQVTREDSRPEKPLAMALNTVIIRPVETKKVRIHFEHPQDAYAGVSELMIWSHKKGPLE